MRRSDPRLRRTSVLLLLALRTGQWTVGSEGGVCRPCGFGKGTVVSPPSDGRLPPEVRTGIRPAAGADRGLRRTASLYLEVHAQGRLSPSRRASVSRVRLPCPIAARLFAACPKAPTAA